MVFLHGKVVVAKLQRDVTITVFEDEAKEEIYDRYYQLLTTGYEAAIFERLIELSKKEGCCDEDYVQVSLSPFGATEGTPKGYEITSVESICEKLAELSTVVLNKRKKDVGPRKSL